MEIVETFVESAKRAFRKGPDRNRAEAILLKWIAAWQGPDRNLTATNSNHGVFLHFNQFIGGTWCKAFTFRVAQNRGFALRGPDSDRSRKSHKLRANKLDPMMLDDLFKVWSSHPEARPAGNAVELFMDEAHDEVWDMFLHEALSCLGGSVTK